MEIQFSNLLFSVALYSEACLPKTSMYSGDTVGLDRGEHLKQGQPIQTTDFYGHVKVNTWLHALT